MSEETMKSSKKLFEKKNIKQIRKFLKTMNKIINESLEQEK